MLNVAKKASSQGSITSIGSDIRTLTVIFFNADPSDFEVCNTLSELQPSQSRLPISVCIIDDAIAEDTVTPELELRAAITGTPISQTVRRIVTIRDNDGKEFIVHSYSPAKSACCCVIITSMLQLFWWVLRAKRHGQLPKDNKLKCV